MLTKKQPKANLPIHKIIALGGSPKSQKKPQSGFKGGKK